MMEVYPTEIWLSLILLLMFVLMFGVFMVAPFFPFFAAKLKHKKLCGWIDRTGEVRFTVGDIRNGMYFYKDKPMHFVKQYTGSLRLYGVPFDIMHIDRGFVIDPEVNAAIAELEEMGIYNYDDLEYALDNGYITEEDIRVPLFFKVPVDQILEYAAEVPPASIAGQVDDMVQSQKTGEIQKFKEIIIWVAIIIMVIVGGAVAYAIVAGVR